MFEYNMDMLYGKFSNDEPLVCSPIPQSNDLVNRQFSNKCIVGKNYDSIPEDVLQRIDTWAMCQPLYKPRQSYESYINLVNTHLEKHCNGYGEDHLAAACYYLMCIMHYQDEETCTGEILAMEDEPVQLSMDTF